MCLQLPNAVRTALADIGKVQVHKNTFKHNSSPFSFGEEKLKEMTGRQTWPSATPTAFANTAIGTTCLVNAFRDASKLRNAHMSLLAVVGWILRPQIACVEVGFYIVCRVTEFGVLARRLRVHERGAFKWFTFDSGLADTIPMHLDEPHRWLAVDSDATGPSELAKRMGQSWRFQLHERVGDSCCQ